MKPALLDVLIADVDSSQRAEARYALEQEGLTCAEARDGLETLDCARRLHPRCLFLDLGLPRLDGLMIARRLRADRRTSDIHIHCLARSSDAKVRVSAAQAGCELFLCKPAQPITFVQAVQRSAWIEGLTKAHAENLLDWLESQGCTHLEVSCPEGNDFAIRCISPPGFRIQHVHDDVIRLVPF